MNIAFTENIMTKLNELLSTNKTVFTLDDLSVIWGQDKRSNTFQSAKEYAKAGKLVRLRRGLYILPKAKPNPAEIANKIVVPSYLTGETVLKKYGLSFQLDNRITSAALVSRKIELDTTEYIYYKFYDAIFFNLRGVSNEGGVTTASRERAIADLIYLNGSSYPFEDLANIDWPELKEIGNIYGKKSVVENIMKLEKRYAEY
jgi:predicted transcriptional regulator of viral defense system